MILIFFIDYKKLVIFLMDESILFNSPDHFISCYYAIENFPLIIELVKVYKNLYTTMGDVSIVNEIVEKALEVVISNHKFNSIIGKFFGLMQERSGYFQEKLDNFFEQMNKRTELPTLGEIVDLFKETESRHRISSLIDKIKSKDGIYMINYICDEFYAIIKLPDLDVFDPNLDELVRCSKELMIKKHKDFGLSKEERDKYYEVMNLISIELRGNED